MISINNHWGISTGNGVITSNKICKDCVVRLCGRKLKVDMLVLDTGGYEVIIDMTLLSKYHIVIDCKNKKVIFRIPNQEFQFIGEKKTIRSMKRVECNIKEAGMKRVPIWDEFLDVFEGIKGLPLELVLKFTIDILPVIDRIYCIYIVTLPCLLSNKSY